MVGLACLALSIVSPAQKREVPAWKDQRDAIQAVLSDPRIAEALTQEGRPARRMPVVIPFVPVGTRFRVGAQILRSTPWLSDKRRENTAYLEIDSLSRGVVVDLRSTRVYNVMGVYRFSNLFFEARVEERKHRWQVTSLKREIS